MPAIRSDSHQDYWPSLFPCWVGLLNWSIVLLVPTSGRTDEVDFNREVRPILSKACFHCHGPDAENREADLRSDTEEGLLGGHAAIVPENQKIVACWLASRAASPDERMPPPGSGEAFSAVEAALIRRWIEAGANK